MCTVTVLRIADLLRVACNRDELRQRPDAHPPFITRAGARLVVTPQDPQGGGTWIAASNAGLVFALLNMHRDVQSAPVRRSRGLLIPMFTDCETLDEVIAGLDEIPFDTFAPCRLLAVDDEDVVEIALERSARRVIVHPIDGPLLFTSSSLGDTLVEGPRRMLFEQMLCASGATPDRQDAFHAHRWRDRPAVSVHMSRPEATTVSTTVVEVTPREVRMVYDPAQREAGTPVGLILDREQVDHDDAPRRTRREHAAV